MTDPDLTAMAADAARLVGASRKRDECWNLDPGTGKPAYTYHWSFPGLWSHLKISDDRLIAAGSVFLFSALLDWCEERGMGPGLNHDPASGLWYCHFIVGYEPAEQHPTKLGALLLAMHRAGVVG